jgi:hypothetical protein
MDSNYKHMHLLMQDGLSKNRRARPFFTICRLQICYSLNGNLSVKIFLKRSLKGNIQNSL